MTTKIFTINLNGAKFLHTQTEAQVNEFFKKMIGKVAYGSFLKGETKTKHGTFTVTEDRWVKTAMEGADDQFGSSWNVIVEEMDGTVIRDTIHGDWTALQPSALGTTKTVVAFDSITY